MAVHPAYDAGFDAFAAPQVRSNPKARQEWAVDQMRKAARASQRLGLSTHVSFGRARLALFYPWPPRPAGLIETAFDELARRWRPILDAFDEAGVDVCYELHPGEDLIDGVTFEMFLERVGHHPRCHINYDPSHFLLQQLDYLGFIDVYHERIKAFHVKDAEFNPSSAGRLLGLPAPVAARRAIPLAGRRRGRLRRHLLAARRLRLRQLAGLGVGVLPEAPGGRRARGRPSSPTTSSG